MDWKVFVMVAILPSALSLPIEFCCQSNSISSSIFNLKLSPSISVFDSEIEPFISPSIITSSKMLNAVMPHEESSSCCSNNNDLSIAKKKDKRPRMKFRTSSGLRRTKRFPIHLDPLYQYRYLARSGRKSCLNVVLFFFVFFVCFFFFFLFCFVCFFLFVNDKTSISRISMQLKCLI